MASAILLYLLYSQILISIYLQVFFKFSSHKLLFNNISNMTLRRFLYHSLPIFFSFSDSSDKTKGRAYLLKKKVLPRWDSNRGNTMHTINFD